MIMSLESSDAIHLAHVLVAGIAPYVSLSRKDSGGMPEHLSN